MALRPPNRVQNKEKGLSEHTKGDPLTKKADAKGEEAYQFDLYIQGCLLYSTR